MTVQTDSAFVIVRPMIGEWEVPRIERIQTLESRRLARHSVPGLAGDLHRLPWLIRHSRRTLAIIRQNIAFALGVKLAVFALAVAGVATLWLAIAADMGASLLVIGNGLRLLGGGAVPAAGERRLA